MKKEDCFKKDDWRRKMTEKNQWKKEIKDIFKTKSKEEEAEEAEEAERQMC